MTIERLLQYIRNARINGKKAEREKVRAEVAARLGTLPDSISLLNCDCRKMAWPSLDAICTDPPWTDMNLYRWLAGMAMEKLRDGGLMLLQCGTGYMDQVLRIMTDAGLKYKWCLSFSFYESRRAKPTAGNWLAAWSPVLVFSKGELRITDVVADSYLVRESADCKDLHDWQQPVKPFAYWLKVMLQPGSLVADPFAGSGTTAVACREGALRFIGTEIDDTAYRVALGRLRVEKAT